jgi:hypothetical protein
LSTPDEIKTGLEVRFSIFTLASMFWIVIVINRTSHNLNSTITEMLWMYTGLKEELIRMCQLKTAHILPLVLSTMGII